MEKELLLKLLPQLKSQQSIDLALDMLNSKSQAEKLHLEDKLFFQLRDEGYKESFLMEYFEHLNPNQGYFMFYFIDY